MTANRQSGMGHWLTTNFWVIVADTAGLALLLSVLLAASGAPALKQWLFVLLMGVPVTGIFMLLAPRFGKPARNRAPVARPVCERRIVISPRPAAQRTCNSA